MQSVMLNWHTQMAAECTDPVRKQELLQISENCSRVPANGATSFYEACQSFWFVQQLLQVESSGHSISPGRFDQYMYPYYKADIDKGVITRKQHRNSLTVSGSNSTTLTKYVMQHQQRDLQVTVCSNLMAGRTNEDGINVTNDLSFMCITSSMHVYPSNAFSFCKSLEWITT